MVCRPNMSGSLAIGPVTSELSVFDNLLNYFSVKTSRDIVIIELCASLDAESPSLRLIQCAKGTGLTQMSEIGVRRIEVKV